MGVRQPDENQVNLTADGRGAEIRLAGRSCRAQRGEQKAFATLASLRAVPPIIQEAPII